MYGFCEKGLRVRYVLPGPDAYCFAHARYSQETLGIGAKCEHFPFTFPVILRSTCPHIILEIASQPFLWRGELTTAVQYDFYDTYTVTARPKNEAGAVS